MIQSDKLNYHLPENLIAQRPLENRGLSRMLLEGENESFYEIASGDLATQLNKGDLLILNNTGVSKCRVLFGSNEFFYLREGSEFPFINALFRPRKKLKLNTEFIVYDDFIIKPIEFENEKVRFEVIFPKNEQEFEGILEKYGVVPIPPYIRKGSADLEDLKRYQTTYNNDKLSIAAPTAGFHFDNDCFKQIKLKGIDIDYLTVNLGLWSIRPFDGPKAERFFISKELNDKIVNCKGKIVAVGTSTVRALETLGLKGEEVINKWCTTDLIIDDNHQFKVVDRMITNFHQPNSTHLMLVCAFWGYEKTMKAYNYAIQNNFRFLSYGDCMLINRA